MRYKISHFFKELYYRFDKFFFFSSFKMHHSYFKATKFDLPTINPAHLLIFRLINAPSVTRGYSTIQKPGISYIGIRHSYKKRKAKNMQPARVKIINNVIARTVHIFFIF